MSTQSEVEDAIMACWGTVEDIELLYHNHGDRDPQMTVDEVSNTLLGLMSLHDMRSQKCFALFQKLVNEEDKNV
jgi:hypothetical protein